MADRFYKMWQTLSSDKIVKEVLKNATILGKRSLFATGL